MLKTTLVITLLVSVFSAIVFAPPAVARPIPISIGVSDNLASDIIRAMKKHPNVCAQDDFFSTDWLRTTLEFFIVCRAIRIGGIEATYSFENFPNSRRAIREMKRGSFLIMADLPWKKFTQDESLYQSVAVLKVGDFVKGIYTRPDHG